MSDLPVLYSFRRCPYAMRARLAIRYCQQRVVLREVVLRDKPAHLLQLSPKATVPVLWFPETGEVLEESLDIMHWVAAQGTVTLLPDHLQGAIHGLIESCDVQFKPLLDRYKYADRYPESAEVYRSRAEDFLRQLDQLLQQNTQLLAGEITLADLAIMPFIRQFASVDHSWFDQSPYLKLRAWLQQWLDSDLFISVMPKYPAWQPGDAVTVFPSSP